VMSLPCLSTIYNELMEKTRDKGTFRSYCWKERRDEVNNNQRRARGEKARTTTRRSLVRVRNPWHFLVGSWSLRSTTLQ
jgi:hypothetical protein